jgi:DeoR/GlpR family transcriptional regulator of sugar metabolism
MPYSVSQETQRLDVAYDALSQLLKASHGGATIEWYVLGAARSLVHDALMESEARDREHHRGEVTPRGDQTS